MLEKDGDAADFVECLLIVAEKRIREAEEASRKKAFEAAAQHLEDVVAQHGRETDVGDHGGEPTLTYENVLDIAKLFRACAKEAPRG